MFFAEPIGMIVIVAIAVAIFVIDNKCGFRAKRVEKKRRKMYGDE